MPKQWCPEEYEVAIVVSSVSWVIQPLLNQVWECGHPDTGWYKENVPVGQIKGTFNVCVNAVKQSMLVSVLNTMLPPLFPGNHFK